jgi:DNA-directed RNA polymerase sigma subunit (sigma70/sigma32)
MNETDQKLCIYLREIATLPTLSSFQQRCLFQELELGGPQADRARARLVEINLRLAVSVARKYQGRGLPIFDLIQEANVGLLRAVDRYNWRTSTVGFPPYATWWMRGAIDAALESIPTGEIDDLCDHSGSAECQFG